MSNSKGKFIVIDGIDGSGKATQAEVLRENLTKLGYEVEIFDFPRYGEKSASLVELYLNGEFGGADEVGPYVGSIFYAVDRYAASKKISEALKQGKIVISNRYVSANKGHQTSKIHTKKDRAKFVNWINELEYDLFGIPVPDLTIFLHVPAKLGYELVLKKQEREYIKGKKQDIHEADKNHLFNAEKAYLELINGGDSYENWVKIPCYKGTEILSIEEISKKVYSTVENKLILKTGNNNDHTTHDDANIADKINFLHSLITDANDMFYSDRDNFCKIADKIDKNLLSLAEYMNVNYIKSNCESCALSVDRTFARLHRLVSNLYESYKDDDYGKITKDMTEISMLLSQFIPQYCKNN